MISLAENRGRSEGVSRRYVRPLVEILEVGPLARCASIDVDIVVDLNQSVHFVVPYRFLLAVKCHITHIVRCNLLLSHKE